MTQPLASDVGVGAVADRVVAAVQSALRDHRGPAALHQPEFRGAEWTYVKDCLDSGWV